jgi:lipopolysaccharide transport system permease protein
VIGDFGSAVQIIWSRRDILIRTTVIELRRKYAGSLIGITWLLLGPVMLMSLYTIIYGVVFKLKPQELSSSEYVVYILSGLVPFLGFSEALTSGTSSLSGQRDILLNSVFPAELVPLRSVLIALSAPTVGLVIVLLADAVIGHFTFWNILVPVVLFFLILFILGVVWVLSLVDLVLKDVSQLLAYVTMVALIASPIAYTPSMLPPGFSVLIWLNPLSYFVIAFQSLIVFDRFPPPAAAIGCVVLGVGSFTIGSYMFQRTKTAFFDHA